MTGGMVVYQHILLCSLEVTLFPAPVQRDLHTGQDSILHNQILIERGHRTSSAKSTGILFEQEV